MRIVKFKSQLTIAFFAAVNHLSRPPRKQNFTLTGSKGHGFWFVVDGFRSVLCVSVFQGSLLVIVIMINGSEKRNCEAGLWNLEFACCEKRSNTSTKNGFKISRRGNPFVDKKFYGLKMFRIKRLSSIIVNALHCLFMKLNVCGLRILRQLQLRCLRVT